MYTHTYTSDVTALRGMTFKNQNSGGIYAKNINNYPILLNLVSVKCFKVLNVSELNIVNICIKWRGGRREKKN